MNKKIFKLNRGSIKLIIAMTVISVIAIAAAKIYYGNLNRAEDPRTRHIKEIYKRYTLYIRNNDFDNALASLENMENAYQKIAHYEGSFETGVIKTNKAALYLNLALYHSPEKIERQSNLTVAENLLNRSLEIYERWKARYTSLSDSEIYELLKADFKAVQHNRKAVMDKRFKDLKTALIEIDRRVSVTLTNMGIIKRYQRDFDGAVKYYQQAVKLWKDNDTARNNLRVLLGKSPRKRGVLEKMFPKNRL